MDANITVRLYEELNDTLPREKRKTTFAHTVAADTPVGVLLERLGVPAEEVEMVLVNGESVDLRHRLRDGDHISVYPVFESFDIYDLLRVRDHPLRNPRFVLDAHLGKLASYLRMLGFDTLYKNDFKDPMLKALSRNKGRILLSKDRGLVHKSGLTRAHEVRALRPREQLTEILERFDLYRLARPFQRCMVCNALLETAHKDELAGRVPPQVWQDHEIFRVCPACHKVYWAGSHYHHMQHFIQTLLAQRHDLLEDSGPDYDGIDEVN
jgi:uncharacterized protein with PIN domain/sulfur carrier protein ThiS